MVDDAKSAVVSLLCRGKGHASQLGAFGASATPVVG